MIIALCSFVLSHWGLIQALLDRRGRKRKLESEIPDHESTDVEVEESEVVAGEQASASSGPVPCTQFPLQEDHRHGRQDSRPFLLIPLQDGIHGRQSGFRTLCLEG